MFTGFLLLILCQVPQEQITKTQVTLEVDSIEKVKDIGKIIRVEEIKEDRFPKPKVEIKSNLVDGVAWLELDEVIPQDVIKTNYVWKTIGPDFKEKFIKPWPDGKSAFAPAKSDFAVILSITYVYSIKADDLVQFASTTETFIHSIDVDGVPNPVPTPTPTPVPTPTPTPQPVPAPVDNVNSKYIYDLVQKHKLTAEQIKVYSGVFATNAQSIKNGDYGKLDLSSEDAISSALLGTKKVRDEAVQKSGITIPTQFNSDLGDYIFSLWETNKIRTLDDIANVYLDCSKGIR